MDFPRAAATCCRRPGPWRRPWSARFPSLLTSLAITAEESAGGLVASIVVGVLVALLFAQSRWVRRMLYPYTLLLQTVPIIAIAPLILMWVGAGTPAVTLIAFIISLAPIIANTTQGLISVEENLVHLFLMHNASPRADCSSSCVCRTPCRRSSWAFASPAASR